ncbi:MAG: PPC domain-containing protein, partial [Candidatus Lokiarchaeota archaeon]|nr:PPC domain-containing protein [Candidatus Lokiarchaeota archaeon]
MRFNKKYKRGLFLLCLLLSITTSISFITINPKNNIINENSDSLRISSDFYEPNNNFSTACNISSYEASWLSSHNGTGTQEDEDWYIIDLDPGEERLKVVLIFNHSEGDIDIEVYDWNGIFIAGNYSTSDNESLVRDIYPDGNYYLRVNGSNAGNTYDLWWEDLMPIDDRYEENDIIENARWVDPNYYSNLKIVDGDEDWFKTYLNSGDTIDLSIYFYHPDGDLQFELYDPSYSYRTGSYSITNDEFIYYTADMAGDWSFQIYHEFANSSVFYDLDIWVYPEDDWMEENDDFGNAAYVDPNYYSGLKIVHGDEDWFITYLNSGDTIDISIYFNHNDGNLELELYDPNDYINPQSISNSTTNDEFIISFTANISGDWRIKVYHAYKDSSVYYDMDILLYGVDDWMEENDDFWNAAYVDPNYYSGLKIVAGDEDWFRTYLNPGDIINISIYFDNYQGDLQLELYDPNDSNHSRAGSYTNSSVEFISFTAEISGDWRIKVYHEDANSEVFYDLDIMLYSGDDWMEENDDYWSA